MQKTPNRPGRLQHALRLSNTSSQHALDNPLCVATCPTPLLGKRKWRARNPIDPQELLDAEHAADNPGSPCYRINWARLLKRVFKSDIAACPDCGGELKIIAAITQPSAINKLLTHFGLPTRAPPRAPAKLHLTLSFDF